MAGGNLKRRQMLPAYTVWDVNINNLVPHKETENLVLAPHINACPVKSTRCWNNKGKL
jgi:hypothetical protein